MSLQKDDMTTRQKQEPHIEEEDYPWILGNQRITSRMGSLDTSIVIYMDIWQKITEG